jgi:hypothetical protein
MSCLTIMVSKVPAKTHKSSKAPVSGIILRISAIAVGARDTIRMPRGGRTTPGEDIRTMLVLPITPPPSTLSTATAGVPARYTGLLLVTMTASAAGAGGERMRAGATGTKGGVIGAKGCGGLNVKAIGWIDGTNDPTAGRAVRVTEGGCAGGTTRGWTGAGAAGVGPPVETSRGR